METAGIKTSIWVTLDFIAFHYFKDAAGEQAFLRTKHRHKFAVKASICVTDLNREIEFLALQDNIQKFVDEEYTGKTVEDSCEQMAMNILLKFQLDEVSVSEDKENGATVYRIKE